MAKIAIFLGSTSDLPVTTKGLGFLREMNIPYDLRIGSAHRTPKHVEKMVNEYEKSGVQIFVGVAGMSAHLAGVVASMTTRPVIAVPVANQATAGFDSLLSMVEMPPGVPVATMGHGSSGFFNGMILAAQILALSSEETGSAIKDHRSQMAASVLESDKKQSEVFAGI